MVESGNSNQASGEPLYSSARFKQPTWSVKVNNVEVSDAILERVELGFGSDLSSAVFTLPRDPSTPGSPDIDDDVQVIVNTRSIFRGKIKIITKHIGRDGLRLTYTAHSNIVNYNRTTVLAGAFNTENSDYPGLLFTTLGIFNKIGVSADNTPNLYPGDVNITDQTKLASAESVLSKIGNYKLYYDMETDRLVVYSLGTGGVNQRSFIVGKNVLARDINVSTENIVDRVIVVGPPMQVRRRSAVNNTIIRTDSSGRRAVSFSLGGRNIRDIVVEGLTREQPKLEFDSEVRVSKAMLIQPSPIELPEFDFSGEDTKFEVVQNDEDFQLREVVLSEKHYQSTWSVMSVSIEQDGLDRITVFLSEVPKKWYAKTIKGKVLNRSLGLGAPDFDPDAERTVEILDGYNYHVGSLRVTYTVDDTKPVVGSGSGVVVRSITDGQYQILVDNANGFSNLSAVLSQMSVRASAELAKLNTPDISGTVRIIGDETVDLRQSLVFDGDALDIVRVVHSFTNGFTTDVTVTNEKLRLNAISLPASSSGRSRASESERDRRRTLLIQNASADILRKKNQQTQNEQKKPGEEKPQSPWTIYKK